MIITDYRMNYTNFLKFTIIVVFFGIFSRTFANGTWGEGTGKKLGRNSWQVKVGPMKNHCNFVRFTKKNQIKILFKSFKLLGIEKISFTMENEKYKINEWLIYGKKVSNEKK